MDIAFAGVNISDVRPDDGRQNCACDTENVLSVLDIFLQESRKSPLFAYSIHLAVLKETGVSHLAKTRRFVTPETSAGCFFHLGDAVLLSPVMRDAACLSDGWLTRRLQHEPTVAPRQGGESLHTEAAAHGKINGLRHVESELGREQHRAARPSKLCGNGRQSAANGGNCRTPFR